MIAVLLCVLILCDAIVADVGKRRKIEKFNIADVASAFHKILLVASLSTLMTNPKQNPKMRKILKFQSFSNDFPLFGMKI